MDPWRKLRPTHSLVLLLCKSCRPSLCPSTPCSHRHHQVAARLMSSSVSSKRTSPHKTARLRQIHTVACTADQTFHNFTGNAHYEHVDYTALLYPRGHIHSRDVPILRLRHSLERSSWLDAGKGIKCGTNRQRNGALSDDRGLAIHGFVPRVSVFHNNSNCHRQELVEPHLVPDHPVSPLIILTMSEAEPRLPPKRLRAQPATGSSCFILPFSGTLWAASSKLCAAEVHGC